MNHQSVKYFHQISPQPLGLDEIAINIRQYLSVTDLQKCMLVSVAWSRRFRRFLWESVTYNRIEARTDQVFPKNAHHIRTLNAYCLDDADLERITCVCSNLVRATLEIRSIQDSAKLSSLLARNSNLQYLSFKPPYNHRQVLPQYTLLKFIGEGGLPCLRELHLASESVVRDQVACYSPSLILYALLRCASLEVLDIDFIRLVTSPDQVPADPGLVDPFADPFPINLQCCPSHMPTFWGSLVRSFGRATPNCSIHSGSNNEQNATAPVEGGATEKDEPRRVPDYPDQFFDITPLSKGRKCLRMRKIRLCRLVAGRARLIKDFIDRLLRISPNLQMLTVDSTEITLKNLATLSPKLESVSLSNHKYQPVNVANLQVQELLINPPSRLREIKLDGIRNHFDSRQLNQLHNDIKHYHLRSLSISGCPDISFAGLGKLINQCWQLRSLHIELSSSADAIADLDDLRLQLGRTLIQDIPTDSFEEPLKAHAKGSATSSSALALPTTGSNLGMSPRYLRWGCPNLRYLDMNACRIRKETFLSGVCDLLESLDHQLDYLGLPSHVFPWLAEERPIRFLEIPDSEVDSNDHSIMTSALLCDYPNPEDQASRPQFPAIALPLGMFGAVKTLSIEASDRKRRRFAGHFIGFYPEEDPLDRNLTQYVYCAFPALERIVYNASEFPIRPYARDWLLSSPRAIPVEYWSKKQFDEESGSTLSIST